ncbi:cytochrome C oxidase subunit IV family protein [Mycolicibacter minnesotensis]
MTAMDIRDIAERDKTGTLKLLGVWAVLVAATLLALVLGLERSATSGLVPAAIIIVCVMKMMLIGMYFMELRIADRKLLAAFATYVLGTCALLLGFYL